MSNYQLKTPKGMEETVIATYKKIERGVTSAYQKIEDTFVKTFLDKVEEAEEQ